MITRLSHTTVYVNDQDRALAFYRDILGFEVRSDTVLDGFRWLTVGPAGQPDLSLLLAVPAPPMFSAEDAAVVLDLLAKGSLGGGVLETEDCRATVAELKAKGVAILQEPVDRPYGVEAILRDDSGNWFSLTQSKRWAVS